jgi:glycosyltransferase involved in cell wall biosynthesis
VRFVGFVGADEKASLHAEADLFILPSKHENFGVAALEALAAGVPVIVTREVQLAGFIACHRLGEVVGATAGELSHAIIALWRDAARRASCGARAPRLVDEAFSARRIGLALREMYDRVSSHAPVAPASVSGVI